MNDNYLDYKATIWFRIPIENADIIPEIIRKIENGSTPNEIFNDLYEEDEYIFCEQIDETEEFMTPVENEGYETIEIFKGERKVWDNRKLYGYE